MDTRLGTIKFKLQYSVLMHSYYVGHECWRKAFQNYKRIIM